MIAAVAGGTVNASALAGPPAVRTLSTPAGQAKTAVNPAADVKAGALADWFVSADLRTMAQRQNQYVSAHPGSHGVAVSATTPGGLAAVDRPGDYPTLPGNVITVTVEPAGFCVSVRNKAATKASTPSASLVFKSAAGGAQSALGHC